MKTHILFDLDGTLTDSFEGITNCVKHALESFGIVENDPEALRRFLGPPLKKSFKEYYGFTDDEAERALQKYRERFQDIGIFENQVYPGIETLLASLGDKKLILATAKPEVYAKRILDYFHLTEYFSFIGGCTLNETRNTKRAVINYVLKENGISPENAVMVGDRRDDVLGAHENKIECVGVLYGYGDLEELTEANADYIVENTRELLELLQKL